MEKIKTFWKHATSMQKGMLLVGSVVVIALVISLLSSTSNKDLSRKNYNSNEEENNENSEVTDRYIVTFKEPKEVEIDNDDNDNSNDSKSDEYYWEYEYDWKSGYFEFVDEHGCGDSITAEDIELMKQYDKNKEKAIESNLAKYNSLWEKITKCYQEEFDRTHEGEDLSLLTEKEKKEYEIPNPYIEDSLWGYYKDNKIKLDDEKDHIVELIKVYMNNISTLYDHGVYKVNGEYYFDNGSLSESIVNNSDVLVYIYVYPEVHDGYLCGFDWYADFVLKEYVDEYKEIRKELDELVEKYPNTYGKYDRDNILAKFPENDKYYLNYYIGDEDELFCLGTETDNPICPYKSPAYIYDILTQKEYDYYEYVKKEGASKLALKLETDTLYKPKYAVNFKNK